MKLTNLTITPKLGILVGVTLVGLCIAGALAGYLMQREMMSARIEQTRAIVEMGRNMAAGLQKQVEAGQLTKEAATAERVFAFSLTLRDRRIRNGKKKWKISRPAAT